jgi:hypothetical protein
MRNSESPRARPMWPPRRCRARNAIRRSRSCIHCESGTVSGDPLTQFTVSDVWAMDDALVRQLEPWPAFRKVDRPDFQESDFANHCPRCGALQEDSYLHSEPDDPFFSNAGLDQTHAARRTDPVE